MLLAFLTMLVFRLGAIFLSRLTVLVGGSKFFPGDGVCGFWTLTVFHKSLEICGLRIETLRNQHYLVGPRQFVGKRFDQFRLVNHWTVIEERWQLSHPLIQVADQSHILPRGQLAGLDHLVAQVALLLGETLLWTKIGNNVIQ